MPEKRNVMIADDSRTVRASLKMIIRSDYEVIEAEDGEDAWEKLVQNPSISMIITDILMPKLDGYGLICRIRASDKPAIRDLPIVVITSSDDDITRERAHACGANDFIIKPVESSDLLERVNFHTEAKLGKAGGQPQTMHQFGEVETVVMESPDVNSALEIIRGSRMGSIDPYALELCREVMPLLEYCDSKFGLQLSTELEKIKSKLNQF